MNPKKIRSARRQRPIERVSDFKIEYIEVKVKSHNGVEYTHYKPTIVKATND